MREKKKENKKGFIRNQEFDLNPSCKSFIKKKVVYQKSQMTAMEQECLN